MKKEIITTMEILEALQAYAERIDQMFDSINQRFKDLEDQMNQRFDQVDKRLDYHESWLKQIDDRFETVATKQQVNSLLVFLENKKIISNYQADYVREA